ncbi:hypothetical protein GTO89_00045 [Heliobacterium gestii]|uniref:Uncharacterized protein n=1 Tax=Heliomicrobium gestii TaxID=2699 RepID=A0A845L741_HELGE|nr:hypothetical protein [Heliomicrobium gestii]MBM7865152.1 hypothetical protein [Heliomicrobium gestii]MZP41421.1 hypothetical protein [Heliomicrobium gestii]
MMLVLVTKVRRRIRTIVRVLVALLLLGLLVPPFLNYSETSVSTVPKEERPTGQPLRVEQKETPLMEQFVMKWKEWTSKKP